MGGWEMKDDFDVRHTSRPLNGWREIAEHLGRNQSTVKRWASDGGLPVHRPKGSAGRKGVPVYAFVQELDAWLREPRRDRLPLEAEEVCEDEPPSPLPVERGLAAAATTPIHTTDGTGRKSWSRRSALIGGAGLSVGLLAGVGLWLSREETKAVVPKLEISGKASDLYNRGLFHMDLRTSDGLSRATGLLKDALALEPGFIDARAALAQAYNLSVQYGALAPDEGYPLALATARSVLAQQPDHPAGLAALAFNTFYWLRNFPAAYDLFERTLQYDPDNPDVHHWYALAIMHDRRFDIAIREIETAQRLAPTSPSILANKALILHHAGRDEEALTILEPLAAAHPKLLSPVSYLATIYLDIERNRDFVSTYTQAADLIGDTGRREIGKAAAEGLATAGRAGMLDAMLEVQIRLFDEGRERAFRLAVTAAYLERSDLALDYLELAVQRNEPDVLGIRLELPDGSLSDLPRYAELTRRVGFSIG